MIEQILCKSNNECVYTVNYDDFLFYTDNLSYNTLHILKNRLNIREEFDQKIFDQKIKKKLVEYYLKQLCDYDFIQRMGQYNGNKQRYYVTIWMKAHVRANYFKIKEDIKEITKEVVNELISNPDTRHLFRPQYLAMHQEQILSDSIENEDYQRNDGDIVLMDESNFVSPNDFYQ